MVLLFRCRKGLPVPPAHPPASLGPPLRRPLRPAPLRTLPSLLSAATCHISHPSVWAPASPLPSTCSPGKSQSLAHKAWWPRPSTREGGNNCAERMKPFPSEMMNSCSIFKASCHRVLGHHAWAHDCPKGTQPLLLLWSHGSSGHAPSRPSLRPLCGSCRPVFSPGQPPLHVSSTKLLVTLFCGPRSQSVKLGLQPWRDRAALGRACVCANVDTLGLTSGRRHPGPGGWTRSSPRDLGAGVPMGNSPWCFHQSCFESGVWVRRAGAQGCLRADQHRVGLWLPSTSDAHAFCLPC